MQCFINDKYCNLLGIDTCYYTQISVRTFRYATTIITDR